MRNPVNRNRLDVFLMVKAILAQHLLQLFTDLLFVVIECGRIDFMAAQTQKIARCSLGAIGGRGGSHHKNDHGIIGPSWWLITTGCHRRRRAHPLEGIVWALRNLHTQFREGSSVFQQYIGINKGYPNPIAQSAFLCVTHLGA